MTTRRLVGLGFLAVAMSTRSLHAELRVARVFGDHMVLQRARGVPIWGTTEPGVPVTVDFRGQSKSARSDQRGAWRVELDPLEATSDGATLTVRAATSATTFSDVVVGEVWLASGQSNMGYRVGSMVRELEAARQLASEADHPGIRFRAVRAAESSEPKDDLPDGRAWTRCTPATVSGFSAVAFVFARRLHAELGVPIGIVDSSRGGTPIEPYIPRRAFDAHPVLRELARLADAGRTDEIKTMVGGTFVRSLAWLPGSLFNSRIGPLAPYAVRGAVWYQGESNSGVREDPRHYADKMRALVNGWRAAWRQPDMPFYFVQLPGSGAGPGWPLLREEQRLSLDLPHTGMVVTIDIDGDGIHPANKIDVGERLARWPLAMEYGRELMPCGPLLSGSRVDGHRMRLDFDHVGAGLMAAAKAGLQSAREMPQTELPGFELSGPDGRWHAASAHIDGRSVIVTSASIAAPIAARYQYRTVPEDVQLYNADGLPASPFCTQPRLLDYDPLGLFPGKVSTWKGFKRHDFSVDGRRSIVVKPRRAARGRPWIWRARFFGHEPQADVALLERGYHLAYCDVAGLFGSPRAVEHWNAFYRLMVEQHALAPRVALEGMSRGGLIIYGWAASNPERVACIYGDAPVCDFRSWPGGQGSGKGSAGDWKRCLAAHGLTEESAASFLGQPIDRLEPIATAKIPILHVIGAADRVVPPAENSAVVEERYRALGGSIHVISKPGVGHHPHSLRDARPIIAFITAACRSAGADREKPIDFEGNLELRGSLASSLRAFEDTKRGHVAFMGGSITEMEGYRPKVMRFLEQRFADTQFDFTAAGIASTCSTTGAFRLREDVLEKGKVDLFIVEFAVNDDQDAGHARRECIRGMEGILRQVRRHNLRADIVVVHFVNPGMRDALRRGETPVSIASHELVAAHYGASSVHVAREVAEGILADRMSWKEFGGTHPKEPGNALAARMITTLLERGWSNAPSRSASGHVLPASIDRDSYSRGEFVKPAAATIAAGWKLDVPDWAGIRGSKRRRFTEIPMLSTTGRDARLTLEFDGVAIGAYVVAGPDAAVLEGEIDGRAFEPVDLHHRFSRRLHYPRTVMFATDLEPGKHVLTLRLAPGQREGRGVARIMRFVVNGSP